MEPYEGVAVATRPTDELQKREPQVHAELGKTEDQLAELGLVVEQLEGRLRCVSRDDIMAILEGKPEDSLVTVAERIRGQRHSLQAIHGRLLSLVERLEV